MVESSKNPKHDRNTGIFPRVALRGNFKKPKYKQYLVIKINKFVFFIVFKRLFNKGNRKHFPCSYRVIETLVEVWEKLEIAWNVVFIH